MISIQKFLSLFILGAASFGSLAPKAFAFDESKIVPNYECRLIVYVENTEEIMEEQFLADHFGLGGHGGQVREFTKGQQKVAVQASNNWIALSWWKGEKLIAAGTFAISKASDFYRVAILANPENPTEQVSLDCNPESAE